MTPWYIALFLANFTYGGNLSVKTDFEWTWDMTNVSFLKSVFAKQYTKNWRTA